MLTVLHAPRPDGCKLLKRAENKRFRAGLASEIQMADGPKPGANREAWAYIDASWQLVGAVGLCTAAGYFADKHFGTTPWLLVAGAVLGFTAGMFTFFRVVLKLAEKDAKARQESERTKEEHR